MAMGGQNLSVYQGEDEQIDFYVTDGDGAPKVLTGATIEWGMWAGDTLLVSKTTGSGAALANGAGTNDVVRITLSKANTLNIVPAGYYHECRIVLGGLEQVIATGTIRVNMSKTKD